MVIDTTGGVYASGQYLFYLSSTASLSITKGRFGCNSKEPLADVKHNLTKVPASKAEFVKWPSITNEGVIEWSDVQLDHVVSIGVS